MEISSNYRSLLRIIKHLFYIHVYIYLSIRNSNWFVKYVCSIRLKKRKSRRMRKRKKTMTATSCQQRRKMRSLMIQWRVSKFLKEINLCDFRLLWIAKFEISWVQGWISMTKGKFPWNGCTKVLNFWSCLLFEIEVWSIEHV